MHFAETHLKEKVENVTVFVTDVCYNTSRMSGAGPVTDGPGLRSVKR